MHSVLFLAFIYLSSALKLEPILAPDDSCIGPSPRPDDYSYFSGISVVEKSGCMVDISITYFDVKTADERLNERGYNLVLLAKSGRDTSTSSWYMQFNETVGSVSRTIELSWNPGTIKVNDTDTIFRAMMIRKNDMPTTITSGDSIPANVTCAGARTGTQGQAVGGGFHRPAARVGDAVGRGGG
jgi:hypothetical protein